MHYFLLFYKCKQKDGKSYEEGVIGIQLNVSDISYNFRVSDTQNKRKRYKKEGEIDIFDRFYAHLGY